MFTVSLLTEVVLVLLFWGVVFFHKRVYKLYVLSGSPDIPTQRKINKNTEEPVDLLSTPVLFCVEGVEYVADENNHYIRVDTLDELWEAVRHEYGSSVDRIMISTYGEWMEMCEGDRLTQRCYKMLTNYNGFKVQVVES